MRVEFFAALAAFRNSPAARNRVRAAEKFRAKTGRSPRRR